MKVVKIFIMRFSALSCYLFLFKSSYSPHHAVLTRPRPVFFV